MKKEPINFKEAIFSIVVFLLLVGGVIGCGDALSEFNCNQ